MVLARVGSSASTAAAGLAPPSTRRPAAVSRLRQSQRAQRLLESPRQGSNGVRASASDATVATTSKWSEQQVLQRAREFFESGGNAFFHPGDEAEFAEDFEFSGQLLGPMDRAGYLKVSKRYCISKEKRSHSPTRWSSSATVALNALKQPTERIIKTHTWANCCCVHVRI